MGACSSRFCSAWSASSSESPLRRRFHAARKATQTKATLRSTPLPGSGTWIAQLCAPPAEMALAVPSTEAGGDAWPE